MKLVIIKRQKVKWSCYRPGVAQRVGRDIAILFHARGTRRGWVLSSTPRPHFTPGKDPVPIVQEAGWVPGPVWTGGKFRPHRDSIPDRPARSQSLYRLSYRAYDTGYHTLNKYSQKTEFCVIQHVVVHFRIILLVLNLVVLKVVTRLGNFKLMTPTTRPLSVMRK